jgi:RNA polymerase sigma-70 factor (ECF subfamily)
VPLDVGALYEAHYGRIYGFIRKRVPYADPADAEDLAQLVFEKATGAAGRWESRHEDPEIAAAAEMVWLHEIAKRVLLDDAKRPHRQIFTVPIDMTTTGLYGSTNLDLEEQCSLVQALDELTPDQRYVLLAHTFGGYEHQEIGPKIGSTMEGSKKMLQRARASMQRALDGIPRKAPTAYLGARRRIA